MCCVTTLRLRVIDSKLYDEYVMNPRVANEMLTPYKAFSAKVIPADKRERYRDNPQEWVAWCADSIAIDRDWNPQNLAMAPASVWTSRITDARSRNIFFVAASRSMGLPARIDPVTEKTQYAAPDGRWIDADFTEPLDMAVAPQEHSRIDFTPQGRITDPQYYSHFTLSRIVNGVPVLLNYPEGCYMEQHVCQAVENRCRTIHDDKRSAHGRRKRARLHLLLQC